MYTTCANPEKGYCDNHVKNKDRYAKSILKAVFQASKVTAWNPTIRMKRGSR